ncbi:putative F-box protein [Cardamine amara subsp. amara]|uniref:F-box protein n=1 Tax=Cardamine amara subsp. amara TaxID=228776 RepID=A0ABD1A781_CARAN
MASSSNLWYFPALPSEVIEENILERIPIEDVVRFKSICKEWYELFKEKRFILKHLNLSKERFIRIYHDKVEIFNPVTLDLSYLPVPSELRIDLTGSSFPIIFMIPCDGLLLCHVIEGMYDCKIAIWNPVLSSRVKWIEPSRPYDSCDTFGFGYDSYNNYKILRFESFATSKEFEIYDLKSKLWRAFPTAFDWSLFVPYQMLSMKGNMYWIAETISNSEFFIQSFDFSRETFKPICSSFPVKIGVDTVVVLPDFGEINFVRNEPDGVVVLSGFGEDRLSLLHQHPTREIKIEVWVTNKVTDALVSWTKYFNVTRPDLPRFRSPLTSHGNPTYFIHKTNGIMLWCDKILQEEDEEHVGYACACFYEIAEGEIRKQIETRPPHVSDTVPSLCRCACVYVPSLVPVPE